jgi:hypothetical protein
MKQTYSMERTQPLLTGTETTGGEQVMGLKVNLKIFRNAYAKVVHKFTLVVQLHPDQHLR